MACYAKVAALHHKQRMKERQSANSIEETFLFDIVSDKTSPGDSRLPALAKSMEWVQLRKPSSSY